MPNTINLFKRGLSDRQQIGTASTLNSGTITGLFASCGFDWILLDCKHFPSESQILLESIKRLASFDVSAIVRPAHSNRALVRQYIDIGVQTLLFPHIETRQEAASVVSYTRQPIARVSAAAASNATLASADDVYLSRDVDNQLCVLVQIDSAKGLGNLEAIALVAGVDGVLIHSITLATAMGHRDDEQHPEVRAEVTAALRRLKALRKSAGYQTLNETEATRRIADGVDFVSVANDDTIIKSGATVLLQRLVAFMP